MVLNPHAESIDEDSDHDPAVEVFTFHNPLQFFSEVNPGANRSVFVLHDTPPPAPTSSTSQISTLRESYEATKGEFVLCWILDRIYFFFWAVAADADKTPH